MTVVVVFHCHIFIPASSENAFIGDNIQCFMQCLLANSTVVRWLSYVVCGSCTFAESLQHRVEVFHTWKLVHHALIKFEFYG